MKIDVEELLGLVPSIRTPGVRIGFPEDPSLVNIADPQLFAACLDDALRAFSALRSEPQLLVQAEVNEFNREIWIRFVKRGSSQNRNGKIEKKLEPSFRALRKVLAKNRGKLKYWGGDNYFDVTLPFRGPMREPFPSVSHLPWDERYRYKLESATWRELRSVAFRFADSAESFAERCLQLGLSRVLVPSVGLCVHPWLFAEHGLSVVATDAASTALAALSEPDRWLRLYARSAYVRWDIEKSASMATQGNVEHFQRMPELENADVRRSLRQRITFARSGWANLPLPAGSVDAIFATNALPRESSFERQKVLMEWVRLVRPGGIVFVMQHNFFEMDVETTLQAAGWYEANILAGERPPQPETIGFQLFYSSG